jgi:hypothetical protein
MLSSSPNYHWRKNMERRTFLARAMAGAASTMVKPLAWGKEPRQQAVTRYPDPAIEILDERFTQYTRGAQMP